MQGLGSLSNKAVAGWGPPQAYQMYRRFWYRRAERHNEMNTIYILVHSRSSGNIPIFLENIEFIQKINIIPYFIVYKYRCKYRTKPILQKRRHLLSAIPNKLLLHASRIFRYEYDFI